MFASPVNGLDQRGLRIAFAYAWITGLCAAFGAIYEAFSHGVYALGMVYAFAFPLLGGVLPALFLLKRGVGFPLDTALQLWHFGISALTVGSLFSGALEIYGTTSRLTAVYWFAGGVCLFLSLLTALFLPAKVEEQPVVNG